MDSLKNILVKLVLVSSGGGTIREQTLTLDETRSRSEICVTDTMEVLLTVVERTQIEWDNP